jgi:hypothetical protein
MDEGPWTRFVAELSTQPTVIEALLSAHVPTAERLCRACTTPGQGTAQKRWPCALWMVADAASRTRKPRSGPLTP